MFPFNGHPHNFVMFHPERPWFEASPPVYNYNQNFNPNWRLPFFPNGPRMPMFHGRYPESNSNIQTHHREVPRYPSDTNMTRKRSHEVEQQRKYNKLFKQVRSLDKNDNKIRKDVKKMVESSNDKELTSEVRNNSVKDNNEKKDIVCSNESENKVTDSENKVRNSEVNLNSDKETTAESVSEDKNIASDCENKTKNLAVEVDNKKKTEQSLTESKNISSKSKNKTQPLQAELNDKNRAQKPLIESTNTAADNEDKTKTSAVELHNNSKVEKSLSERNNENENKTGNPDIVLNKNAQKPLIKNTNTTDSENKAEFPVVELNDDNKKIVKFLNEGKNTAVDSENIRKSSTAEFNGNTKEGKYVIENKSTCTNIVNKVKSLSVDHSEKQKSEKSFTNNRNTIIATKRKLESTTVACNNSENNSEECLSEMKNRISTSENESESLKLKCNDYKIGGKEPYGKIKIALLCNSKKTNNCKKTRNSCDNNKAVISSTTINKSSKSYDDLEVNDTKLADDNISMDSAIASDKDCIELTDSSPTENTESGISFDDCFIVDNQSNGNIPKWIDNKTNANLEKNSTNLKIENHSDRTLSSLSGHDFTSKEAVHKGKNSLNLQMINKTNSPCKGYSDSNSKSPSKQLSDDTSYESRMKKLKLNPEDLKPKSSRAIAKTYSLFHRHVSVENDLGECNKIEVICGRSRRAGTDSQNSGPHGSCSLECISPDTAPVVDFSLQIPFTSIYMRRLTPHITENDIARELAKLNFKAQYILLFRLNTGASGGYGSMVFSNLMEAVDFMKQCRGVLVLECQCRVILQYADVTDWLCHRCSTLNLYSRDICSKCRISKFLKNSDLFYVSTCVSTSKSCAHSSHTQEVASTEDSHNSENTPTKRRCVRRVDTTRISADSAVSSLSPSPSSPSSVPASPSLQTVQKPVLSGVKKCLATTVNSSLAGHSMSSPESPADVKQGSLITESRTKEVSFSFKSQNKPTGSVASNTYHTSVSPEPVVSASETRINTGSPVFDCTKMYPPPDKNKFTYDESIGYYYDPTTGLYFNEESGFYINVKTHQELCWNAVRRMYMPVFEKTDVMEKNAKLKLAAERKMFDKDGKQSYDTNSSFIEVLDDWKCCFREAKYFTTKLQNWRDNFKLCNDSDKYSKEVAELESLLLITKNLVNLGRAVMNGSELHSEPCLDYVRYLLRTSEISSYLQDSDLHVDMKARCCLLCNYQFQTPEKLIWHLEYSKHHKALVLKDLLETRRKQEAEEDKKRSDGLETSPN